MCKGLSPVLIGSQKEAHEVMQRLTPEKCFSRKFKRSGGNLQHATSLGLTQLLLCEGGYTI